MLATTQTEVFHFVYAKCDSGILSLEYAPKPCETARPQYYSLQPLPSLHNMPHIFERCLQTIHTYCYSYSPPSDTWLISLILFSPTYAVVYL